jgi:hypothetical protein
LTYRFDESSRSPILLFAYPRALPRGIAYIAREVRIECGSLTDQKPIGHHQIQAFVADVAPGAFTDFGADVVALELERTFWEKATILHAEFHRPPDKPIRDRYARHYSDFAALWTHPAAFSARTRLDLLERVRIHKSMFFSSSWASFSTAKPGTFRLHPPEHRIKELRADYEAMQQMFLGVAISFDDILEILRGAETTLNRL